MQEPVAVSSVEMFVSGVNNSWLEAEINRRGLKNKRVRDAGTGEFVDKEQAILRPRETVAETVKKRPRRS